MACVLIGEDLFGWLAVRGHSGEFGEDSTPRFTSGACPAQSQKAPDFPPVPNENDPNVSTVTIPVTWMVGWTVWESGIPESSNYATCLPELTGFIDEHVYSCLLYTSPSPRDA